MKKKFRIGQTVKPTRACIRWYADNLVEVHQRPDGGMDDGFLSCAALWWGAERGHRIRGKVTGFGTDGAVKVRMNSSLASYEHYFDPKDLHRLVWK